MNEELIINTKIDIDYADAQKQLNELNKKIDKAIKDREIKIKLTEEHSKSDDKAGDNKASTELSDTITDIGQELSRGIANLTAEIQNLTKEAGELSKSLVGHAAQGDKETRDYIKEIHDKLIEISKKILDEGSVKNSGNGRFKLFNFLKKKKESVSEKAGRDWNNSNGLGTQTGVKTSSLMEFFTSRAKKSLPGGNYAKNAAKAIKDESGAVSMSIGKTISNAVKSAMKTVKDRAEGSIKGLLNKAKTTISNAAGKIGSAFSKTINGVKGTFSKITKSVPNAMKRVGASVKSGIRLLSTPIKGVAKVFGKFKAHFTKPVSTLNTTLGGLLKKIVGFAGLAAIFGKFVSYLQQVLKRNAEFRQAAADLKGALYTLAQPLIEVAIPIVITAVKTLTILVRTLASLVATAFGKSFQEMADNAESTYQDVVNIKKTVAGYDELNVIGQDDTIYPDFSDVTTGDLLPTDDPRTLGQVLADWVNSVINSVDWEGIGKTIGGWIDYLIQAAWAFLNGVDFSALGKAIASLINGALSAIDFTTLGSALVLGFTSVLDTVIGFLEGLDWSLVGKSFSDLLIGALSTANSWLDSYDWDALSEEFKQKFRGLFDSIDMETIFAKFKEFSEKLAGFLAAIINTLVSFADTTLWETKWGEIGEAIAAGINVLLEKIDFKELGHALAGLLNVFDLLIEALKEINWKQVGQDISDFLKGLFDGITEWFNEHDWEDLGTGLTEGLEDFGEGFDGAGVLKSLTTMLGTIFSAIGSFLKGFLSDTWESIKEWWNSEIVGNDWAGTASNLLSKISEGIGDVKQWVMDNIVDPFMSSLIGGDNWDELKTKIDEKLDEIANIGAPISLVAGLILLFTGNFVLGLGLLMFGIDLLQRSDAGGADFGQLLNVMKEHIGDICMIGASLMLVVGLILMFTGHPVIGIGLLIAGVAALSYVSQNMDWDWLKDKLGSVIGNVIVAVAGVFFVVGLVLLILGHPVIGLGLILAGVAAVITVQTQSLNWDWLKEKISGKVAAIIAGISALFLVIGILLAFNGLSLPIAIGLILVGVTGLVTAAPLSWDWLKEKIKKYAVEIAGISSILLLFGILLCCTGVAIPIGIALIAAGVAGIVTAVAVNWDTIVNKVKEVKDKIVEKWNDLKTKLKQPFVDAKTAIDEKLTKIKEKVVSIKGTVATKWGELKDKLSQPFKDAKSTADEIFAEGENKKGIAKVVAVGAGAIKKIWTGKADGSGNGGLKGTLNGIFGGMKGSAEAGLGKNNDSGLRAKFKTAKASIQTLWRGTDGKGGLKATLEGIYGGMKGSAETGLGKNNSSGLRAKFKDAKDAITKLWQGDNGNGGLKKTLCGIFAAMVDDASKAIGTGSNQTTLLGRIYSAKQKITNWFTGSGGLQEKINGVWKNIKDSLKSALNGIITYLNTLIDGVNSILTPLRAVIVAFGKISGTNWTMDEVAIPQIPKLAQGMVVPPNREFMALLGDNKKETEVVSPLSTMREAVRAELEAMGYAERAPIVLQLDGKTVAQVVWDEQNKQYKQYGSYAPRYN